MKSSLEGGSSLKLPFSLFSCHSEACFSFLWGLHLIQVTSCPCSPNLTSITDGGFSDWFSLSLSGLVYQLRQMFFCPLIEDAPVLPHVVEMGCYNYTACVIRACTCGHMCFLPLLPPCHPGLTYDGHRKWQRPKCRVVSTAGNLSLPDTCVQNWYTVSFGA